MKKLVLMIALLAACVWVQAGSVVASRGHQTRDEKLRIAVTKIEDISKKLATTTSEPQRQKLLKERAKLIEEYDDLILTEAPHSGRSAEWAEEHANDDITEFAPDKLKKWSAYPDPVGARIREYVAVGKGGNKDSSVFKNPKLLQAYAAAYREYMALKEPRPQWKAWWGDTAGAKPGADGAAAKPKQEQPEKATGAGESLRTAFDVDYDIYFYVDQAPFAAGNYIFWNDKKRVSVTKAPEGYMMFSFDTDGDGKFGDLFFIITASKGDISVKLVSMKPGNADVPQLCLDFAKDRRVLIYRDAERAAGPSYNFGFAIRSPFCDTKPGQTVVFQFREAAGKEAIKDEN